MALGEIQSGLIPVSAQFSLEVFAGDCVVTLGLVLSNLPAMKPWDSKLGEQFDVLREGQVLLRLSEHGWLIMTHLGTPCQSLTWARGPRLRSMEYRYGLPTLEGPQFCFDDLLLCAAWA